MSVFEFVKVLYSYNAEDETIGLKLIENTVLQFLEDRGDGWSKGVIGTREGWYPTSYVKKLTVDGVIDPVRLAAVIRSSDWTVCCTDEDKFYYLNKKSQETTWELPAVPVPQSLRQAKSPTDLTPENGLIPNSLSRHSLNLDSQPMNGPKDLQRKSSLRDLEKPKKSDKNSQKVVNGITFPESIGDQKPLHPGEDHYCDYFWSDTETGTGFEVTIQKATNGKYVIKEMSEFMKERAVIEEQYARSLLKLSKSQLGETEEGTLRRAWQIIKTELAVRAKIHSNFAGSVALNLEKPLLEYKEALKQPEKEYIPLMDQKRRQLKELDMLMEKAKGNPLYANRRPTLKALNSEDFKSLDRKGRKPILEDATRMLAAYNDIQQSWLETMIQALQEMEQQEEERSDNLKGLFLKYIDLNVQINENIAVNLQKVHDTIEHISKKADRELFIKHRATGRVRPVSRDPSANLFREC